MKKEIKKALSKYPDIRKFFYENMSMTMISRVAEAESDGNLKYVILDIANGMEKTIKKYEEEKKLEKKEWHWSDLDAPDTWETRPYKKCPKCNEFKFTAFRKEHAHFLFIHNHFEYWWECKNCRYREEIDGN